MPRKTQYQTPTVLVAGGAGFLGSHLCETLLERGCKIICVDSLLSGSLDNIAAMRNHPAFTFIEADICDDLEIKGSIDQIFNMACPASPPRYQANPVHTVMTSVVGTNKLLSLAARHGARMVQASTSEIYGDPDEHPQRETYWGNVNCTGPRACYDEGKRTAETLCFDWMRTEGLDVRVARIFNTYGPRMRADDGRIVSNFIVQALDGEALSIFGSGEQTRSFCYVSDLIDGLIKLMTVDPNPGVPINLGNPTELTVIELAKLVLEVTGTPALLSLEPLPVDDPRRRRPDISQAAELLGWKPAVDVRDGIRQTADWFSRTRCEPQAFPAGETVASLHIVYD
ncbi:UDP-glucuronic acid decarboxylase family protein [Rhizobium sp. L1K21]|uniref:UDP-glucuronic acid decarboxylase family protein n=1 Tax=Rhizobium sp. L1K21 TaxID=2954933 RepID=UPI002093406C|nr:UDP-glucuronic acid decarboxylase family protein [Rhizobium sp. L1K21]MCO6187805.1 SDR family oxidoreductase [Rhizobium sp. L1K21]